MADPITRKELKAMGGVPYDDLRTQLRSGDLLFCSGDYMVSKMIQHFTDSPWSHVGIILRVDAIDRLLLLESVEDMGVRFAPLSKYLDNYENGKGYKGQLAVARHAGVKKDHIAELAGFGCDELTRPYDKDEIGKIAARISLGIGRREQDREYICSELVYECFSCAGIEIPYNEGGYISPQDVWADGRVEMVGKIGA